MSQLANFYVLPADRFEDLIIAATPRVEIVEERRLLFFKKPVERVVDGRWGFLRTNAREPEDCPLYGGIFGDLDLVLEPDDLFQLATRELSDRLSAACVPPTLSTTKPSAWPGVPINPRIPVFDHSTATRARQALHERDLTGEVIREYARENYPPEDEESAVLTITEALELTKRWLESIKPGEIGLLLVG